MSQKQKKIFWLHPHFLNWMGGHKYIFEITKRLSKKYDVIIVSDVFSEDSKNKFCGINVHIITLGKISTNSIFYWIFLPYFMLRDVYIMRKYINSKDILITSMFPMNVIAMILGNRHLQLCYEPFAFFHDNNFISGFPFVQRVFIKTAKILYSWLDIFATRRANKVLTLSEFNKKWIRKIYKINSTPVYEGVDTSTFKMKIDRRLKNRYKNFRIIFHSTDFTKIKGTDYLFKAMPSILNKVKNAKLLISSTLQNKREIKRLTCFAETFGFKNNIEFLGLLPHKTLPYYLSLANVVVQPSVGQSMNLTIKEAMSCSTPVITSLEGKEQFDNETAGYLINPRFTTKLSKGIITILLNKKLSKLMGKKGLEIIKKKFSWRSVFDRISVQLDKMQYDQA